jgi:hypothetical protein
MSQLTTTYGHKDWNVMFARCVREIDEKYHRTLRDALRESIKLGKLLLLFGFPESDIERIRHQLYDHL